MFLEHNTNIYNNETGEGGTSSLFFYGDKAEAADVQTFTIDGELDGHRLDFAVSRLLGISRSFSQTIIKSGGVKLSTERRIKSSMKVADGNLLSVIVPPVETLDLEPEDVPFEVVYSDEDIVVVNKPAELVVHPAPGHWRGTLVHGLLYRFADIGTLNGVKRPGIVHRLDATTSGLMVVARNGLAQEGLFRDFKARRVEKAYIALGWGAPKKKEGAVCLPIARDPYNRLRMAIVEDGRESRTDYRVLWSHEGYSLLQCTLHTGRTHQIRVHMQAIRCPLVGDKVYAPSRPSPFAEDRVFLHSWKLGFAHPRTGAAMRFMQPLPDTLIALLQEILSSKRKTP